MDKIIEIVRKHNLFVVEDATQGVMSEYKGQVLGTIGNFGCYSFHETKNLSMGEGGATLTKDMDKLLQQLTVINNSDKCIGNTLS